MKCPYCAYQEDRVIDSRPTDDGATIRRRRECARCLKRFTTYEKVEILPLIVIKKDNTREVFDRQKIRSGLIKACEKRPVSADAMELVIDELESQLSNTLEREITSKKIGELLVERLKKLDQVAYVRFASVYREFEDVSTFMEEIKRMQTEGPAST